MSTVQYERPVVPKGARLLRKADDPNEIVIFTEWDSLEKARKFAQSEDLKKTMQQAGVIDDPDVYLLEEIEGIQA